MLPTRAWELLTGVTLSLGILPRVKTAAAANLLSLTGAALLLLPMFTLTENMVFPGINAVPPVLGAALIIYSGEHRLTAVSRILGNRGLVAIGLVSYSLYLWHWPVTVYTNDGVLYDPKRASADGADRLQPAVPVVCGVLDG